MMATCIRRAAAICRPPAGGRAVGEGRGRLAAGGRRRGAMQTYAWGANSNSSRHLSSLSESSGTAFGCLFPEERFSTALLATFCETELQKCEFGSVGSGTIRIHDVLQ